MARNTSILLGDYFDNFISSQLSSGRYNSVSEVIRAALRLLEYEQTKKELIIAELKKGEESDKIVDFDRDKFLEEIHSQHLIK